MVTIDAIWLGEERREVTEEQAWMNKVYDIDKRTALLEQGQVSIKAELQAINGHLTKLVWLVFSALVLGIMAWVLRGGLNG